MTPKEKAYSLVQKFANHSMGESLISHILHTKSKGVTSFFNEWLKKRLK